MTYRFSLNNLFLPVSFKQFQSIVGAFQDRCANAFGCECILDVRAMSAVKWFTTHMPDDGVLEFMDDINRKNTFFTTDDLAQVTPAIFDSARYIDIYVRPQDATKAPRSAFGAIEFKGYRRRQATFYVQPDGTEVFKSLGEKFPTMHRGNGYSANCDSD